MYADMIFVDVTVTIILIHPIDAMVQAGDLYEVYPGELDHAS